MYWERTTRQAPLHDKHAFVIKQNQCKYKQTFPSSPYSQFTPQVWIKLLNSLKSWRPSAVPVRSQARWGTLGSPWSCLCNGPCRWSTCTLWKEHGTESHGNLSHSFRFRQTDLKPRRKRRLQFKKRIRRDTEILTFTSLRLPETSIQRTSFTYHRREGM